MNATQIRLPPKEFGGGTYMVVLTYTTIWGRKKQRKGGSGWHDISIGL